MARSTPSLLALLGLAAVAGYQNRDKLREAFGQGGSAPGFGGAMGGGDSGMGSASGGSLLGGLGELLERLNGSGHSDVAQSWVGQGTNRPVAPQDLQRALGPETLADLSRQTGLTEAEVLQRLTSHLPEAVNQLTPQGRLPTEDEARNMLG